MAVASGPNVVSNGLVFAIDTASPNSISGLGCTGFNNAPQLLKDLITKNRTITSYNGVRLANMSFYTTFGISYPEGSYGGDAASRQGVTPGYDVRSGSKTYDASRSLHMWVWNENTQSWVPDSYFRGLRLSGHCYDNWNGYGDWQVELNYFNADLAAINAAFPNCTYIICGSHAAQNYDTATINNLISLGAPSATVSSWNSNDTWREFVLVGKPGLGSGNAYGWVYQNYSTNPSEVAHLNFGLPAFGNKDYLSFDGTNDYIAIANDTALNTQTPSVEVWIKTNATSQNGFWFEKGSVNTQYSLFQEGSVIQWRQYFSSGQGLTNLSTTTATYINTSNWYQVVGTFTSGDRRLYINGVQVNSDTQAGTINTNNSGMRIGSYLDGGYFYNGSIAVVRVYNKVLSPAEVLQNFNAQRDRFGI